MFDLPAESVKIKGITNFFIFLFNRPICFNYDMKIHVNPSSTARRLRFAMDRCGMKAAELALRSGVNKSSISQYLNNSHTPSNFSAQKLANVLGVNMVWLMGFDVPMDPEGGTVSSEELSAPYRVYPVLEGTENGVPKLAEKDLTKHTMHMLNISSDFVMLIDKNDLCGKRIQYGDVIFIRKERIDANGELVLVTLQDEIMVKRIFKAKKDNSFILMDDTDRAVPEIVSENNKKKLHILGRIVAVQHSL